MSDFTEANEEWILKFESGKNWIPKLPSRHTKRIFIRALQKYCQAVKQNPDELINLKIEGLKAVATEKEFGAERQLETYLRNSGMTDSVKAESKNAIISFYKHNWRNLNPNVASDIEPPEAKKRTPTIEDIQALDANMTTSRDKALVWFFPSTAVRIETLTKLTKRDLKPTGDSEVPYYMEIESARLKGSGIGKYKGIKQITFVHKLAWQRLEDYFAEAKRKGYNLTDSSPLFIAYKGHFSKEEKKLAVKPKRIRVMTQGAINQVYDNGSLSAWKDLEQKRFSPHDFRDFLESSLESAGIDKNLRDPMMAHKVRGVDKHYSSHEILEMKDKYKTALPYLLPQSVEKLKAEADKVKEENEKRIKFLEQRLLDNGLSINKMLTDFNQLKATFEELQKLKEEEERNKPEKKKVWD
ncbi:MAG: hypothetical protein ABSC20_00960 [Candidatus Bathyarchaeia archaeon]|jgi:hypothetical protein